MALVQAGKQFTADSMKQTAGNLAAFLTDTVQDATDYAAQLASMPDPDLIELGLTQPEINAIKGFFIGDMPAIKNAVAASQWIRQLLGTGV